MKSGIHIAVLFVLLAGSSCLSAGDSLNMPVKIGQFGQEVREFHTESTGLAGNDVRDVVVVDGELLVQTAAGWQRREADQWKSVHESSAPASGRGLQSLSTTQLLAKYGSDRLPLRNLTCSSSAGGKTWFGSDEGVVRFDSPDWAYRQGKRWLPSDDVRAIAATDDGGAWIATAEGLAHIFFRPMMLKEKAVFYESEIDLYNRRTEFGYVIEAHTQAPGDKTSVTQNDSDNDGLWTAMYGAGECFAWAATKDPEAKRRAKQVFEALRFLSIAPRGGSHPAPRGFIARTVVPTSEADPNAGYTVELQRRKRDRGDAMWRVYEPRWPTTEDGRYYWKSDTSSDELDGHYFFNALYFDLVADTEEEKDRVREIIRDNIEHMIAHDFSLHDHAGLTRWAVYSPSALNHDPRWATERGLNSLSMLSYLATAAHITGDNRYLNIAAELRDKHGYAQNIFVPKVQAGIGTGNQSDDEMAFMCFYNLLNYETNPALRMQYAFAFNQYWQLESPEMNPFFNFCYAATGLNRIYTNQWGSINLSPHNDWLIDSADTLKRFPLDRFDWAHRNSHRADLVNLPGPAVTASGRQMRKSGKVIPVDECHFNHLNYNPWQPNTGGSGHTLSDGTVFLLPYYMGMYHGFITD